MDSARRWLDVSGSSASLKIETPAGSLESPGAAVFVEDGGGTGAIEVELDAVMGGISVGVGRLVCPSAQALAGAPPWQLPPRVRCVATAAVPGATGWILKVRPEVIGRSLREFWRVGLQVGKAPAGKPWNPMPIWTRQQQSGAAPVVLPIVPGMRILGVSVAAGPAGATLALPWGAVPIVVPGGRSYSQTWEPETSPICPLSGPWVIQVAGDVVSWTVEEGL